jgi:hypothetical protein
MYNNSWWANKSAQLENLANWKLFNLMDVTGSAFSAIDSLLMIPISSDQKKILLVVALGVWKLETSKEVIMVCYRIYLQRNPCGVFSL